MIIRNLFGLLLILFICSCAQQDAKSEEYNKNSLDQHPLFKHGLKIEYGPNLGSIDKYAAGDYIFISATITNDSTIPIRLQVAISGEYDFPDSCSHSKYKVFLLPKELTPDTATLYNNITDGVDEFLNRCLDEPYILDKTLKQGEYTVITIGTLLPRPSSCPAVLPRAIFEQSDASSFFECDNRIFGNPVEGNQDKSTKPNSVIGIKFVYYRGKSLPETCVLFPCGQISYSE